ncbi:MAG: chalcone isomerase family protein [Oceanospirillaceae bacterium]|nr:chalcone isomerase family protein [Oceanospirillaceae bacterium]
MPDIDVGARFSIAVLICLSMFTLPAMSAQELPQQYKPVGAATLRVLWFDVYAAELRSPDGVFSAMKGPLLLKLTYLRDIKRQKLLDETAAQLESVSPELRSRWLSQLEAIWPDIGKGDQLWFYLDAGGKGHFYFNERYIGSINDIRFGTAFLSIWLAEDSSYPDLARKLRGET